jgi:hypothetical protein
MNRLMFLRIANMALLVCFALQAVTSTIIFFDIQVPNMKFVLKSHIYNGLAMIALAMIHIILNWGWIRTNYFRKK